MSSRRIVTSIAALATVVLTSWFGVTAFPLHAAPSQAAQTPPRDRRPGEAVPETSQEVALKKAIAADSTKRDLHFQLADLQQSRGAAAEAEATLDAVRSAFPNDKGVLTRLAATHNQAGRFDQAISVLEDLAALNPNDAQARQNRDDLLLGESAQRQVAVA